MNPHCPAGHSLFRQGHQSQAGANNIRINSSFSLDKVVCSLLCVHHRSPCITLGFPTPTSSQ